MKLLLFLLPLLCLPSLELAGQLPSPSPPSSLRQVVGNTTVTIDFERPAARGRKIFGGLVPWGQVWRTGAGYCTKLGFDRAVTVGGQPLAAGKYALLTIPGREEWMIILNRDTTLYGSRDYNADDDLVRFRVPAQRAGRFYEALTIDLDITPDNARCYISWAEVQVSFPIVTDTEATAQRYIERIVQAPQNPEANYGWAAEYLLMKRSNLNQVLALAERELRNDPDSEYARRLKIEAYAYLGYHDQALRVLNETIDLVNRVYADQPEQKDLTLGYWEKVRADLLNR